MLGVRQDLLGHLLHRRVGHQMEWCGDTVWLEHKQPKIRGFAKKNTNMFNEFAHSSLCDSPTTENLNSIPSSVLPAGRRIALQQSNLSSELTRLLTIRLIEMLRGTCLIKGIKKLVTMLHI